MSTEPALDEKIVLIASALTRESVPFAFGGALALAYYAEPRATIDVDVNIFATPELAPVTFSALQGLGARVDLVAHLEAVRREGAVRIVWGAHRSISSSPTTPSTTPVAPRSAACRSAT